jgi:hypothetical protein
MGQVILGVVRSPCADFEIRLAESVTDMINGRKERQGRFEVPPIGLRIPRWNTGPQVTSLSVRRCNGRARRSE